jgi:hypothetical protein
MPDFPDRGSFTYDRVSGTGAYAELKNGFMLARLLIVLNATHCTVPSLCRIVY